MYPLSTIVERINLHSYEIIPDIKRNTTYKRRYCEIKTFKKIERKTRPPFIAEERLEYGTKPFNNTDILPHIWYDYLGIPDQILLNQKDNVYIYIFMTTNAVHCEILTTDLLTHFIIPLQ